MSDRKDQESRWSSAREREERDRQRKAQREEAKRARLDREANEQSSTSSFSGSSQRRLTDEERRTIREYRFPSASEQARPGSETAAAPLPPTPARTATASSLASAGSPAPGTSTRWRDSVSSNTGSGGGSGLPDLPGDGGGSGGKRPGNGRLLIFGIGLFAVMALVAFLPFGPLGDDDERAVPTSSAILPTLAPIAGDGATGDEADEDEPAEQPQADDGQAVVCIDPGHGGWDTGWHRTDQGDDPYSLPTVTEAELNLGMAYMLRARLEELGYYVVMTRESGASVNAFLEDINEDGQSAANDIPEGATFDQIRARDEFQARINACNEAQADVLLSLHVNGIANREVRGYEVLYTAERDFGEQNELLATLIYRQMDAAMRDTEMSGLGRDAVPDTVVESVPDGDGFAQHLIMTGPGFEEGSIEPSLMPGAIIECAFLSNDSDAAWLVQTDNQHILADAYAQGVDDYFERYPPT